MSLRPDEYSVGPERCAHGVETALECLTCEDNERELNRQRAFAHVRNRADAQRGIAYRDSELDVLRHDLCDFGLESEWERFTDELCGLYLELRLVLGAAPDVRGAA